MKLNLHKESPFTCRCLFDSNYVTHSEIRNITSIIEVRTTCIWYEKLLVTHENCNITLFKKSRESGPRWSTDNSDLVIYAIIYLFIFGNLVKALEALKDLMVVSSDIVSVVKFWVTTK